MDIGLHQAKDEAILTKPVNVQAHNLSGARKMDKYDMELRRKKYFTLSSQIAQLDNTQLRSLLENNESNESTTGWGQNQVVVFGQSKVFVKRVPVTNLEYNNLFSTKNFYNLPTSFSYGIATTGFGVWRELITHIKTTHWVLEEGIENFPLMYHYRIIPFFGRRANNVDSSHWENNANVQNYVLDRANTNYELVIFLEYIPYVLDKWLQENSNQFQKTLNELCATIDFLRKSGIIHFDAHFKNILTDGERTYLTDFGLVLDKSFALTPDEESFFEQNAFYDYGEVLRNVGHLIWAPYNSCSEDDKSNIRKKYGIKESLKYYEQRSILLDNIEQIHADGIVKLDEYYVATIVKYRSIITLMQNFFSQMWGNKMKDTKLRYAELRRLLIETGFIPGNEFV